MCALSVARKSKLIDQYSQSLEGAKIGMLTGYSGCTVDKIEEVREKLRKEKSKFIVLKNTLFKIAVKDTEFKELGKHIQGPVALVVSSEDVVGPAKVLEPYFSDDESKFRYVAAIGGVHHEPFTIEQIRTLAKLPSRDVLLGKCLGSMQAPLRNLMGVLQAIPRNLVSVLSQVSSQSK